MGSVGKAVGSDTQSYNGPVSNVANRETPMSEEDREQVSGGDWDTRYFQSPTSFTINSVLRDAAEKGVSVEEALNQSGVSNAEGLQKTIDVMDRNMRPTDTDMSVVRLADKDFGDAVFSRLGISTGALVAIHNMKMLGKVSDTAMEELQSKLVGARITESSYMSTTYNTSMGDMEFSFLDRPIKMEMSVKAGVRGMFNPTGDESEFVLARDTSYVIKGVQFDRNTRKLVLSVDVG